MESHPEPEEFPPGEEDDAGDVFLNEEDVVHEVLMDEEELPDVDEEEERAELGDHDTDKLLPNICCLLQDGNVEEDDSIHIFTGHTDSVYAIACSPIDSDIVATGGGDDKAYLWRLRDSRPPSELKGHSDSVAALAFSSDGHFLASGGLDGIVNIWESSFGVLKWKLEGPNEAIEWVKWHPLGHVVLAGSEDFTSWMWNADNGACLTVFAGKSVCTGSADGTLRIWNPRSGESTHIIKGHPYHSEGLTCLCISTDSGVAITGSMDCRACLVNFHTGKVVGTLNGHTKSIECVGLAHK